MLGKQVLAPEPDQGHPRPSSRNEVRAPLLPNFPKHRWFLNIIHNVWRHNLQ